jgi:general secretion pathway protein A
MYKAFYGLEEPPFHLTPDPRFLFLSQRHREAIAALMYGINERKGFICLTGEIGAGKTTLCRALMGEVSSGTKVALILNPSLDEVELLQSINHEFGIPHESMSKRDLLEEMNKFLLRQRSHGHTALLIIDESQNLSPGVLEQIRMISNLETEVDKLIQIVLLGQPELQQILALPELEQLNQRITVRYHITSLTEEETELYIHHRLFIAKAKVEVKLQPRALRAIFEHTCGVPRKINVLMDRALLTGYVEGTYEFTEDMIRRAITEVRGSEGFARRTAATGRVPAPAQGRTWVKAALAMAAVLVLFAAGGVFALQWVNGEGGIATVLAAGGSRPDTVRPGTLPTGAATAGIAPPEHVPLPPMALSAGGATPEMAAPWAYDQHNIVRVGDQGETWHAALLTLMSIWSQRRYDLTEMGDADAATRQRILEAIYGDLAAHGFHQVDLTSSLANLLRCDAPMLLSIGQGPEALSPHVILLGTEFSGGQEVLMIADPVHGLLETSRATLGSQYQGQATALYPDPVGLSEIEPGEEGDRVRDLQRTLIASGHLSGALTGVFDDATREAVRDFQRDSRLTPSGLVDDITAMHLVLMTQTEGVI